MLCFYASGNSSMSKANSRRWITTGIMYTEVFQCDVGIRRMLHDTRYNNPVPRSLCVRCLHIEPFFLTHTQPHQYTQCPCWFFILEIQILWSQTVRQRKTKTTAINQGKASAVGETNARRTWNSSFVTTSVILSLRIMIRSDVQTYQVRREPYVRSPGVWRVDRVAFKGASELTCAAKLCVFIPDMIHW